MVSGTRASSGKWSGEGARTWRSRRASAACCMGTYPHVRGTSTATRLGLLASSRSPRDRCGARRCSLAACASPPPSRSPSPRWWPAPASPSARGGHPRGPPLERPGCPEAEGQPSAAPPSPCRFRRLRWGGAAARRRAAEPRRKRGSPAASRTCRARRAGAAGLDFGSSAHGRARARLPSPRCPAPPSSPRSRVCSPMTCGRSSAPIRGSVDEHRAPRAPPLRRAVALRGERALRAHRRGEPDGAAPSSTPPPVERPASCTELRLRREDPGRRGSATSAAERPATPAPAAASRLPRTASFELLAPPATPLSCRRRRADLVARRRALRAGPRPLHLARGPARPGRSPIARTSRSSW